MTEAKQQPQQVDEYEDLVGQHRMSGDDVPKPISDGRILRPHTKNNPTLSWPELRTDPLLGHPRFFVFRSLGRRNIHAVMNMWLNVAFKDNKWVAAPFISPIPLNQWYETNGKTGRTYLRKTVPECPLGRLRGTAQDEVLGRAYKSEKPAMNPTYYMEAFEVEFSNWTQKLKTPGDPTSMIWVPEMDPLTPGRPKMKVNPKAFILELRPNMMIELTDKVLSPKVPTDDVDPLTGETKPSSYVPLPTTDAKQVLVEFRKVKEGTSGDPAKDVRYHMFPHAKITFDSSTIQEVDPLPRTSDGFIDWATIFPAATQDEVDEKVAKYFGGEVPQSSPASADAAAQAAAGGEGPPPADDDIPF